MTLKHGSNSECLHQRTPRELCTDDFEIREDRYDLSMFEKPSVGKRVTMLYPIPKQPASLVDTDKKGWGGCCGVLTWGGGRWCRPWWWGRTPGRTCWWRAASWGCWSLHCSQHSAGYWAKAKGVYAQVLSMSRLDLQTLATARTAAADWGLSSRVGTNLLFARTRGPEELRTWGPGGMVHPGVCGAGVGWCLICSPALTLI